MTTENCDEKPVTTENCEEVPTPTPSYVPPILTRVEPPRQTTTVYAAPNATPSGNLYSNAFPVALSVSVMMMTVLIHLF